MQGSGETLPPISPFALPCSESSAPARLDVGVDSGQLSLWASGGLCCVQVRFLEQQNKVLDTKWTLLQEQGAGADPQGLESFFEAYVARLRQWLEQLQRDGGALEAELKSWRDQEEEYKAK